MNSCSDQTRPLMFGYWGARGALPKLTLDLAHVASQRHAPCTFSISGANELLGEFAFLREGLFVADLFETKIGSLSSYRKMLNLRSRLLERFSRDRTSAFVSLMSHVWSPLVAPLVRQAGVRHVVIAHDAEPHPGDHNGLVTWWLLREAATADCVITLSKWVAQRLAVVRGIPEGKISVLFHPDLNYGRSPDARRDADGPLRILFMGRILPYKGLDLLVDAVEILRREGVALRLGVFGSGRIAASVQQRLVRLDAEVVNRWLAHDEFGRIFSSYDILVAAHTEASQSGVVAAALGAGLPVVVTPVGGLAEQITSGVTGMTAASATPRALADAIGTIADNRLLLKQLREGVTATRTDRSVERFFDKLSQIALDRTQ